MRRALPVRALLFVMTAVLVWACGSSGDSERPFPVENQSEWKQYLQGTWEYAGPSPSGSVGGIQLSDSLYIRATFRGDTLDYLGESHQGNWDSRKKATCAVSYGAPYELEVSTCVRGLTLRLVDGDTAQADRFAVAAGSPRSKKEAFYVGSMFPSSVRSTSLDSLYVMNRGGTKFYLTRK